MRSKQLRHQNKRHHQGKLELCGSFAHSNFVSLSSNLCCLESHHPITEFQLLSLGFWVFPPLLLPLSLQPLNEPLTLLLQFLHHVLLLIQLPLLQVSDAFTFYARRNEVRMPAVAHAHHLC